MPLPASDRLSRRHCVHAAFVAALCLAMAWSEAALAQRVDGGTPGALLRPSIGSGEAAGGEDDIFSDGGIGQEERDAKLAEPIDLQRTLPLSDDAQGRAESASAEPPVASDPDALVPGPRDNLRMGAVEPGVASPAEADPFLPTGFRAGTWQVFTRLDQALGYTNNTSSVAGGKPGSFSRTKAGLTMRSDWARHEASVEANGSVDHFLSGEEKDIPQVDVTGALRLDLIDGVAANLRATYNYSTEATNSDALGGGVSERPGVNAFGASAEIARSGGKVDFSLRGSADRTLYDVATTTGGGLLDQADRDNTLYQATARAGYGVSEAMRPFVQAAIGRRIHDLTVDRNGEKRDSTRYDLQVGLAVDLGEKLRGEASVGYLAEVFDDSGLRTLATPSFNANLVWSPERETQVTFTAATSLSGSTTAGESGSSVQDIGVEVERHIRERLTGHADAGLQIETFDATGDRDFTWTAGAGLKYWINRFMGVTADVGYERLDSSDPASSYEAATVMVGVSLQR